MTKTFDNIWDALIDDPSERDLCKKKSDLMMLVERAIRDNTVIVTQTQRNNIMNGKINKISLDTLETICYTDCVSKQGNNEFPEDNSKNS